MNPSNKRIGNLHSNSKLHEILKACEILQDDSDKISLLIDYIQQLNIDMKGMECPSWIEKEDTLKLLCALEIIPRESHSLFNICESTLNVLVDCYYKFIDTSSGTKDKMELVEKAARQLSGECSKRKVTTAHIFSLISSLERLDSMNNEYNLGERVVSGAISSLLQVICSINGHFQNGDKQREIILDDSLPILQIKNDGTISRDFSTIPYFLREDKSFDRAENRENDSTDAFKLILSMKSTLREKLLKERVNKEDRLKYNKILGLNFLKSSAHLFLLEVDLIEESKEIIPYFYLSHRSYPANSTNLIAMWMVILRFSIEFVPKRPLYANENYGPTHVPYSKVLTQIGENPSNTENSLTHKSSIPKTKVCKKVVKYHEREKEQRFTYLVLSSSFLKKVTKDEMSIVVKLVELDNYSPHLPRVLNIYRDLVEFEVLECLPNLTEDNLIDLTLDISKALYFLHDNHIIHRDVKPANIMIRKFNEHCREQFVLIDFGLSFAYYKKENHCVESKNLGTEYFKAPEVKEERNYDEKIDIYSLGSSIIYLMMNSQKSHSNWKREAEELKWKFADFKQLVLQMIDADPVNRPSALNIIENMTVIRNKICSERASNQQTVF